MEHTITLTTDELGALKAILDKVLLEWQYGDIKETCNFILLNHKIQKQILECCLRMNEDETCA